MSDFAKAGDKRERARVAMTWALAILTAIPIAYGWDQVDRMAGHLKYRDGFVSDCPTGQIECEPFIVERADGTGEHDPVRIALARVSALAYAAICDELRAWPGVARLDGGHGRSGDEYRESAAGRATMADHRFRSTSGSAPVGPAIRFP
ncbi:hypothetical protein [Burkholderia seminalis]|uniref:hypothetical protein n=1 Tax=Burkholderia seminalis TaxID=488731 RepID=UPI00084ED721|nr:hypothetical protein [Burkholderia seminalis]MDN7849708.1 hypothetical protein [Burkholderia seminalis]